MAPQNQLFLSYFFTWYRRHRRVDVRCACVAICAGFGALSLCLLIPRWLQLASGAPQGKVIGIACAAGAVLTALIYRTLANERAKQAAATELASALLDANRECMKLIDLDGNMLRISEYGAGLMDAESPAQLAGAPWLSFWRGEDGAAARTAFAGALAGRRTAFSGFAPTATGRPKRWDTRLTPIKDEKGRVIAVTGASLDVTSHSDLLAQLQAKNELMSEMEAHVPLVFYSYGADFKSFHHVSAGCFKVFGLEPAQLLQHPSAWMEMVLEEDLPLVRGEMDRIVSHSVDGRVEYRIRKADGSIRWLRSTGYPVQDEAGTVLRIIGITEDITAEQERIATLDRAAFTDSLTGLANRAALFREIEARCAAHTPFGLMFVDLDRFKVLNDTLGHVAADRLLKGIGDVIKDALPPDAYIARLGGDEFAVLIGSMAEKTGLEAVADALLVDLSRSGRDDGAGTFVTASIGISLYPEHGANHEALLTSADVAMYAAKKAGRNCFMFAGKEAAETIGDFELERDVPEALASDQFLLHYQTIHEPRTLTVHSAEALIRWQHPRRGLIPPGVFVPILEETGFIADVGAWVLNSALSQLAQWRGLGAANLGMSVNVSARQLRGDGIVWEVERALLKFGVPPAQLEIELTETALMENPYHAQKIIAALKALGVRIAIDDFGTGYSTLKYLADFAPDTLKIDRSFTSKLVSDPATQTIVEGIVDLSRKLGIKVVAEGVEEQQQLDILRDVQCDFVQGFFLCRPQPPAELERMLHVGADNQTIGA
ncbi:putative bifunctional diguanylate cyclase/phosphodiesterase [Paraburkholderia sp. BCC1885]|uniref:putative bifunctional diguanylate cyclase/phosphodiesterase n=1 Tax=Paraburkholderia sp. BCC1885 TaxID=2562669 RepID=UPI0021B1F849|nr:EAL domain-containing protein [Paraburkholderia sp. BCC1885]